MTARWERRVSQHVQYAEHNNNNNNKIKHEIYKNTHNTEKYRPEDVMDLHMRWFIFPQFMNTATVHLDSIWAE